MVVWTRDRHVLPDDGHGCRGRCTIIRGPRSGLTHGTRGRLSYFVSPARLLAPVREHSQLFLRLKRIVGLENDSEVVLAFHALMHHELHGEIGLLSWLQCRRTDDNSGRSAAVDDFSHGRIRDRQWFVADVGELEAGFDRLAKGHVAEVNPVLVYLQPRASGDFGRRSGLVRPRLSCKDDYGGGNQHHDAADQHPR